MTNLVTLSILIAIGAPCWSDPTAPSTTTTTTTTTVTGVLPKFNRVDVGVYRGPRPKSDQDVAILKRLGVKTVVDLQGGDLWTGRWHGWLKRFVRYTEPGERLDVRLTENESARSQNVKFVNVPLNSLDALDPTEEKQVLEVVDFIHNPDNQPVYVHCEHGQDRTGLVMALYEIKYLQASKEEAVAHMAEFGHDPNAVVSLDHYFTGGMDSFFNYEADQLIQARASQPQREAAGR